MRLISALVFPFSLFAQVQGPPLKVLTCELYLKSDLKQFAVSSSVLPLLEGLLGRLSSLNAESKAAIRHDDLFYSGLVEELTPFSTRAILERLHGIEGDLRNADLDRHVVAFAIQGPENLQKALVEVKAREEDLRIVYDSQIVRLQQNISFLARLGHITLPALFPIATAATLGLMISRQTVEPYLTLEFALGLILSGTFGRMALNYSRERVDLHYEALISALERMAYTVSDQNEIFINSTSFEIPGDFHRMLMAKKSYGATWARTLAVRQWGYQSLTSKLMGSLDLYASHLVGGAPPVFPNRVAFVDNILFREPNTFQPVWLVVYRALNSRPNGLNPSTVKNAVPLLQGMWPQQDL